MKIMMPVLLVLLVVVSCIPVPPSSTAIPVQPNELPIAYIDSITSTTISQGQTITFTGHGTDVGGTVVAYRWRSDKDGALGSSATLSTTSLTSGNHYVYFSVQDNRGDWSKEVYASITVLPTGMVKPSINVFTAKPDTIVAGEYTTLEWNVSDAVLVNISPDIGDVSLKGSRQVSPRVSGWYTLTASNQAGKTVLDVRITVAPSAKKVIEINSIPEEEGSIKRNGEVSLEPNAGMTVNGTPMQAFFSFDISMIPQGAKIKSASLDLNSYILYGYPFGIQGALGVFHHQYGVLEPRDYTLAFTMDGLVYAYTEQTIPYTSSKIVVAVQKQIDEKSPRFQIRVQFEKFTYYNVTVANYLAFNKGMAKLIVEYE